MHASDTNQLVGTRPFHYRSKASCMQKGTQELPLNERPFALQVFVEVCPAIGEVTTDRATISKVQLRVFEVYAATVTSIHRYCASTDHPQSMQNAQPVRCFGCSTTARVLKAAPRVEECLPMTQASGVM